MTQTSVHSLPPSSPRPSTHSHPPFLPVFTVLLHLRRVHALGDFFRFVDNKPDATALLQVYAKENDIELLRDFYYQDDRRKETACLALEESWSITVRPPRCFFFFWWGRDADFWLRRQDFGGKVAKVRVAQKAFAEDKDSAFEAKVRFALPIRRRR